MDEEGAADVAPVRSLHCGRGFYGIVVFRWLSPLLSGKYLVGVPQDTQAQKRGTQPGIGVPGTSHMLFPLSRTLLPPHLPFPWLTQHLIKLTRHFSQEAFPGPHMQVACMCSGSIERQSQEVFIYWDLRAPRKALLLIKWKFSTV